MTKAEMYGGPFDGRQLDVPNSEPVLRVPVGPGHPSSVLVARYVRCDHLDGTTTYRYQGQEHL